MALCKSVHNAEVAAVNLAVVEKQKVALLVRYFPGYVSLVYNKRISSGEAMACNSELSYAVVLDAVEDF
jgi:hypothetical protein